MTARRRLALAALATASCVRGDSPPTTATPESTFAGSAAPLCVAASPACVDRIAVGAMRLPYYRTHAFSSHDADVTSAIVVVHGANRDFAGTFLGMVSAARTSSALADTVVVAPMFQVASPRPCFGTTDTPTEGDAVWGCAAGNDWMAGYAAQNSAGLLAFEAADALLAELPRAFPRLQRITVVGFSAGGQLVQRYAALRADGDAEAPHVRYVIGDPSSWMYFDSRRLRAGVVCEGHGANLGEASFVQPASTCDGTYDRYRYGLGGVASALPGYVRASDVAAVGPRFASRDVTYVVGEQDTGTGRGTAHSALDVTCAARLQGRYRADRAFTFFRYVSEVWGAHHRLVVAPECAHDATCVYASAAVRRALFTPNGSTFASTLRVSEGVAASRSVPAERSPDDTPDASGAPRVVAGPPCADDAGPPCPDGYRCTFRVVTDGGASPGVCVMRHDDWPRAGGRR